MIPPLCMLWVQRWGSVGERVGVVPVSDAWAMAEYAVATGLVVGVWVEPLVVEVPAAA